MSVALGVLFFRFLAVMVPVSMAIPNYPPAATTGGTVVASLDLLAGSPREIKILGGQEPFVSAAREALQHWRFSSPPETGRVAVVVCFREPGMFAIGTSSQIVDPEGRDPRLPFPTAIYEPALPANSLGEGSVVLGLKIGTDGAISDVKIVRPSGILTGASVDAVRRWKFRAAKDRQGRATASETFAVFVFRPPVMSPGPIPR